MNIMPQSVIRVCGVATATVDNFRTHMEISVQNFFHMRVKFIIFPLVHEETQIQNLKCCKKCEVKLPVAAACVWTRPTMEHL
jgi:hypothetical protein